MAFKNPLGKLYLLLGSCLPEDERIKAQILYNEIIESDEYRALATNPASGFLMRGGFAKEQLNQSSAENLAAFKKALPYIDEFLSKLTNCVKYGSVRTLTPNDVPDFLSSAKLQALIKKLSPVHGRENYTNINNSNLMEIFNPAAIKDADEFLDCFDCSQFNAIKEHTATVMSGRPYCLDSGELNAKINKAATEIASLNGLAKGVKLNKRRIIRRKASFTLIGLLILALVSMTNLLHTGGMGIFSALMLALILLLWIVG
jgi:hypothetical protein